MLHLSFKGDFMRLPLRGSNVCFCVWLFEVMEVFTWCTIILFSLTFYFSWDSKPLRSLCHLYIEIFCVDFLSFLVIPKNHGITSCFVYYGFCSLRMVWRVRNYILYYLIHRNKFCVWSFDSLFWKDYWITMN